MYYARVCRRLVVVMSMVALSACVTVSEVRVNSFNPGCAFDDQRMCRIGIKGRWDFVKKDSGAGTDPVVSVLAMLTDDFYISVATNRVRLAPTAGSATVRLTYGDTIVAQTSTTWVRSIDRIYLNDPMALRAWLEANGDAADGIAISFSEMELEVDGLDGQQASVTITGLVSGVTVASGTSSGILRTADGGGCRFGNCEQQ